MTDILPRATDTPSILLWPLQNPLAANCQLADTRKLYTCRNANINSKTLPHTHTSVVWCIAQRLNTSATPIDKSYIAAS